MPKSKHRRKPSGKSIKHPGRGRPGRELPPSADQIAFRQFNERYRRPFNAAWPDHEDALYMLDLVSDTFRSLHAASRDELLASFMSPQEDEYGNPVLHTREQAEAALAFLEEQDMVVIDGDQVSIPSRFVDEFGHPPAQIPASEDRISVGESG